MADNERKKERIHGAEDLADGAAEDSESLLAPSAGIVEGAAGGGFESRESHEQEEPHADVSSDQLLNEYSEKSDAQPSSPTTRSYDDEFAQELLGEEIDGRYIVESVIGGGGMGVVYSAKHTRLERDVVIKFLRPSKVEDEKARQRFEREARRVSQLNHSNIVTVHDFGYHDRLGYLVMEYIRGVTLSTFIKQHQGLLLRLFSTVALQILDGLSRAHQVDMIHRDLKPGNIMLTGDATSGLEVKILDFGLAKLMSSEVDVTQEAELLGSMSYIAPERIIGENVDQRVDIYSLGILFYYMLTGEKPFTGEDMTLLYHHVHSEPPSLAANLPPQHDIPTSVIEFVEDCMSKDPADRPFNSGEAATELRSALGEVGLSEGVTNTSGQFFVPDLVGDSTGEPERLDAHNIERFGQGVLHRTDEYTTLEREEDSESAERLKVQPQESPPVETSSGGGTGKWLVIGAIVLALAGAGVYAVIAGFDDSARTQDDAARTQAEYTASLDKIEASIENKRFGLARQRLERIGDDVDRYPKLADRVLQYENRLQVAQLLVDAKYAEKNGKLAEALSAYREIARIDSSNETARGMIDSLSKKASLRVVSNVPATVYVDGKKLGETPIREIVPTSIEKVELKADGYEAWTKMVAFGAAEQAEFNVELARADDQSNRRPPHRVDRDRRPKRQNTQAPDSSAGSKQNSASKSDDTVQLQHIDKDDDRGSNKLLEELADDSLESIESGSGGGRDEIESIDSLSSDDEDFDGDALMPIE